jgi:hypothetical protein
MEIYNLTYLQFLSLPEDYSNEMQEVYMCLTPVEVNCQKWTWGKVKEVQDMLNGEITFNDILEIAKKEGTELQDNSPAHVVFSNFLGVRNSINEISKIESEQWTTQLTPKQEQALNEVGGFSMFGAVPQTLRLTELLNMSYNDVLNVSWETCFAAYSYDVKSNEYNNLILKST